MSLSDTLAVAPLVGAWIEMARVRVELPPVVSLLSWERGLKFCILTECHCTFESLLSWERGLKLTTPLQNELLTRRSSRGSVD